MAKTDRTKPAKKPTEQELIKLVRRRAQRYLNTKGVTSVGVGYRIDKATGEETDELCIQFTVEEKVALESLGEKGLEKLPDFIEDEYGNQVRVQVDKRVYEPTVIIVAEREDAEADSRSVRQIRRSRQDPLHPGISIAHKDVSAGTLGAVVYDKRTGQPYVLSNWHVLHGSSGEIGDRVIQPGSHDGGSRRKDFAGRLVRSHLGLAGDCAIASIEDRAFDERIVGLDVVPERRIGKVELRDRVVKSGRTTGVTRGIVKRTGVTSNIAYRGVGMREIGGFEIRPDPDHRPADGEVSKGGDSGSVWMIAEGEHQNVVVGLHFAGESDPAPEEEKALACNIHSVFEKLDVSFNRIPTSESDCALLRRSVDAASGLPVEDLEDEDDELDLNPENLAEIQQRLFREPRETLEFFRRAVDQNLTEDQLEKALEDVRFAFNNPGGAERSFLAAESLESAGERLPDDFSFPGMDLERYPINPSRRRFESAADAFRWILYTTVPFLFGADKEPFRGHDDFAGQFRYPLPEPSAQSPFEVALFSDWGTGEYQSNYISKQLEDRRFPLGIHCGDVYYAGRKGEFKNFVRKPLQNVVGQTELFFLNANHEMYRGGRWYFDHIDRKRLDHPGRQRQEGSYFALESEKFQLIGIDTAYHEDGRFEQAALLGWLEARLVDGRQSGRSNILFSANHPYEYGEDDLTDLLTSDLRDLAGRQLIDMWFWGNTHYCALFNRGTESPFIGSCIGHGGYPYGRKRHGELSPAPLEFLETQARFPASTDLRQGRGNNGFCVMTLHADGSVGLRYLDWMTRVRAEADIARDSAGRLSIGTVRPF